MQIPVCYIDQRDIMYNKYYHYTGTYRIYFRFSRILSRGEGWLRPGWVLVGRGAVRANARPLLYLDVSARAHMHTLTHTHPHVIPTTRMYTAGKSIYFIYYYYYYFPRALSVKRYRLGNLFGRIYGEEEQSNCRLRLRRWRILINKIIYIL